MSVGRRPPDQHVKKPQRSTNVVKSTVEQLSPTRVKLNVEVPFEELSGDFDRAYQALAHGTRDHREAVDSMLEKRAPSFEGR